MQQGEKKLQIEEQKNRDKAQADQQRLMADLEKSKERNMLERDKMASTERQKAAEIGAKVASDMLKISQEGDKLQSHERLRGVELGVNLVNDLIDDGTVNGSNTDGNNQ